MDEMAVAAGEFIPIGSGPGLCVSSEDVAAGLPRHMSNDPNAQWRNEAAATPLVNSSPWRARRVLGCFLVAVVYSLTDEYHQSFVLGRHASLADCGIDAIGAAMGILAYTANHLRLRTVGLCATGILPGLTHARSCPDDFGRDGHATIPSGGESRTRQNYRIAPIPGRDDA